VTGLALTRKEQHGFSILVLQAVDRLAAGQLRDVELELTRRMWIELRKASRKVARYLKTLATGETRRFLAIDRKRRRLGSIRLYQACGVHPVPGRAL